MDVSITGVFSLLNRQYEHALCAVDFPGRGFVALNYLQEKLCMLEKQENV